MIKEKKNIPKTNILPPLCFRFMFLNATFTYLFFLFINMVSRKVQKAKKISFGAQWLSLCNHDSVFLLLDEGTLILITAGEDFIDTLQILHTLLLKLFLSRYWE